MDSSSDGDFVTLICSDPHFVAVKNSEKEILISTVDIHNWDFPTILSFQTVKIQANRNRLVEQSSYFQSLLSGSFSEAYMDCTSIKWNVIAFLYILKYIYDLPLEVASDNFLSLYEGALYFGVETLLLKCNKWFSKVSSVKECEALQIQLEDLIHIWKFGLEHESDSIPELCISYLARNFMLAISNTNFGDIPYDLLSCSIKHPQFTIDSEMHLFRSLLLWVENNVENVEIQRKAEESGHPLLKEVRLSLLPLWLAAGTQNSCHSSELARKSVDSIFRLANILQGSINLLGSEDLLHARIRLTKYSQKVDLSCCPQITSAVLLFSVLPLPYVTDPTFIKSIGRFFVSSELPIRNKHTISHEFLRTLSFEAVQEVDISKCYRLNIEDAIELFCNSFPCLRILKAAFLINIMPNTFLHMVQKCRMVSEIDLTVDITPVLPSKMSVLSSISAMAPVVQEKSFTSTYRMVNANSFCELSNITTLVLEGRTEVCDSDLQYISKIGASLKHLNLKGCMSVTDVGISNLIHGCKKLNNIVACDTSFGVNSVRALFSTLYNDDLNFSSEISGDRHLNSLASKLETLHIGGCKGKRYSSLRACLCVKYALDEKLAIYYPEGIEESLLTELMFQIREVKSLCLRDTELVDEALYCFQSSSLVMLDVSNTVISGAALTHVVCRNPVLICLKVRGCRNLICNGNTSQIEDHGSSYSNWLQYDLLGEKVRLEEMEIGWGLSHISLKALGPAIMSLRRITVGLGGTFGEDALIQLPATCPMLQSMSLHFQVISDNVLLNMMGALKNLKELALCYCFGDISISSFKLSMSKLRKLRLERVTPWLTNHDVVILTQSFRYLRELSFSGCPLLNEDTQKTISQGWPGLVSIYLEDCGAVTGNGVSSLFDCRALEDIMLRHNGCGLQRNFISETASKFPMLRKLSLDLCDASDGGFDIPSYVDRHCLSILKIARCKTQRCAFSLPHLDARKGSVHKDTLVLVWNSKKLDTTVVKERL